MATFYRQTMLIELSVMGLSKMKEQLVLIPCVQKMSPLNILH